MISFGAHRILNLSFEKLILIFFLVSNSAAFAQGNCGNVGFEDGTTSGWTCRYGTYSGKITSGACADQVLSLSLPNVGCLSGDVDSPNNPVGNENLYRHSIMANPTLDPNSLDNVSSVAPGNMFPLGVNKYSFRIGNATGFKAGETTAFAESVKYSFVVTKDNAGLTYMYAAFLCEFSPIHTREEAPRFEIKVTVKKNGKEEVIDCGYYQVIADGTNSNFKNGKSNGADSWKYTPWTKVALDLSGFINQEISIEFTTADCYVQTTDLLDKTKCSWSPGSHSAYAYIDLYCTPVEIISPSICANQESITLCAPAGYASYEWPAQPGLQPPLNKQCVTVKNPKAGTEYNVTMKSIAGGCPTSTKIALKGSDFVVKDTTICKDALPTKLFVNPTTPGDYSWKWEPSTYLDCDTCQTPNFKPGESITYTITMSDKKVENCNQVKELKVKVIDGFTVSTSDVTICENDEATLTATGADSYIWQPGSIPGATIKVKPATTTTYTVTGTLNGNNCPGKPDTTATVTVNLKPVVIVNDITICKGESAKLNGKISGGTTQGTWIGGFGKFTPSRTALDAVYTPTVEEQDSAKITLTLESADPKLPCVKESKTMAINITPPVTSNAGPDQTICEGESVTLAGVFGGAATQGKWTNGTGTYTPSSNTPNAVYQPSVTEIKNGKAVLKFEVSNASNATCPGGIDEMIINIDKLPTVFAGLDQSICFNQTVQLNGSIGGSAKTATWSGGGGTFTKDNKTMNAVYRPTKAEVDAGTVTLTLTTDQLGKCPPKESKTTIRIYPEPKVNFSADTLQACPPHCVDFTDSSAVAGSTITKWLWDFGVDTSSAQNPSDVCFPKPGFYDVSLVATSKEGCASTLKKDLYLETYKTPIADFTADPFQVSKYDPTIQFYDQSSKDVISWKWDLGDGKIISPKNTKPLHTYEVGVSAIYTVKLVVINDKGCVDSTYKPVEVLPEFAFYIPNAFTPNRIDGINDTFYGKGVGINEYHIWIFDRWGNKIFNTTDINEGWDGRANNGQDIAQQDVYVWKVRLTDIFGKRHDYIGTVTLVR